MSGLTSQGFVPKTTAELKLEIENALVSAFGSVNLAGESVFGQLVGLTVDQQRDFWLRLEEVYWSQYPDTAQGINLDRVVSINGLVRQEAAPSTVQVVLRGTEGTVLTAGKLVSMSTTGTQFALDQNTTISRNLAAAAQIEVGTLENSVDYSVTIGGSTFTYGSDADATEEEILTGLNNKIDVAGVGNTLFLGADGNYIALLMSEPTYLEVSARLNVRSVSSFGQFTATQNGAIDVPEKAVDTIVTPVSGWASVSNRVAGTTGKDWESDQELRIRRETSLKLAGRGTLDSVISQMQQVEGVLSTRIVANNTASTNAEGIPPQHIRAIVDGGTPQDIGRVLFNYVSAGIGYHGSQTVAIESEVTGDSYDVKFDRPTNVPVYFEVTVQSSDDTPTDAIELIRGVITEYISTLDIGDPLLYTRLFGPISAVIGDGAYVSLLYTGLASSPTGVVNITPDPDERLVTDTEKIQVYVV